MSAQAWIVKDARCWLYYELDGPYAVIGKKGQWVELEGSAKKIQESRLVYSKAEAIDLAIEHHKSRIQWHDKHIRHLESMR